MQEDYLDSYYDFDDSDTFKLRAGKSNLPQAGLGLFSTGQFEKGEYITEYYGSIVTVNSSWNEIFNDEDKMVQIDKQYCLIGRSLASRANDIINFNPKDYFSKNFEIWRIKKNLPRIFGIDYNAKLSMDSKQKVFLKATNKIRAGQEIYIEYGFDYWLFYYQFLNGKYLNQTK